MAAQSANLGASVEAGGGSAHEKGWQDLMTPVLRDVQSGSKLRPGQRQGDLV